jgi:hypothetical protein
MSETIGISSSSTYRGMGDVEVRVLRRAVAAHASERVCLVTSRGRGEDIVRGMREEVSEVSVNLIGEGVGGRGGR